MDIVLTFFGRFHPLLVHLPIGFILMGLLFECYKKKIQPAATVLKFIFFWASVSSLLSIVSGIFQFLQEGYIWGNIQGHFIAGVATFVLTLGFYLFLKGNVFALRIPRLFYTLGLFISLMITGHLGGNITHGDNHLTEPLEALVGINNKSEVRFLNVDDYSRQKVYSGLIEPILSKKCVRCHNPKKAKGQLQMHTYAALQKGGKNGIILDFNSPESSEILNRIHLPEFEKKHMPPRAQKQLTQAEKDIINYWVLKGAPEFKTLGELGFNEIQLNSFMVQENEEVYPSIELDLPDKKIIDSLQSMGILITPVKQNSNLLFLSTINYKAFSDNDLGILASLNKHIVSIDLSDSNVTDAVFTSLSKFSNLVSIKLNRTAISGQGIDQLSKLDNLKKIHLINTNLKSEAIQIISGFKPLIKAFVFQFNRDLRSEISLPPEILVRFDFGNYLLEDLPSDTVVY